MTRYVLLPALLAALVAALPAPTAAQKPDEARKAFFDSGKIVKLSIELGPKELDSLRREPRKYVKATLKEDDKVVYQDVGVHLKGAAGSFRGVDDKPGLTLNMDKFARGQHFHGLDKFHLANSVQDPSYISELLCGELFRAAGVPASRVTHAVVTINGKPRGFYYLKEGYDKGFLRRHFGTSHGNFYDGGFLRDVDQPLQHVSGKEDVPPQADLKKLVAAAREGNPKERVKKMEAVLDVDKFVRYLALEAITWDWDGYPMNRNNYRIYHDPKRDRLVFLPSGMDQMFGDPNGPIFPNFQGFVARALIETPEGKARYLAAMNDIMKNVYKPDVLLKRLDELQARVQPALAAVDAGAGRDYPNHVNRLRQAVQQRAKSVNTQLAQQKK